MNRRILRRIFSLVIGLVIIYAVILATSFIRQRSLMYVPNFPNRAAPPPPAAVGLDMEVVHTTTQDGLNLLAWFAPPSKAGMPVVVVFHGNAGNLSYRAFIADAFIKKGYGVYLAEYRGYGGNGGTPTEPGFYADGRSAIKWIHEKGYKDSETIIYGESIGTGVAVQMATEFKPKLLILQSAYSSFAEVAKTRFWFLPVDLMLFDRFDSDKKIGQVSAPVLIIHGEVDNIIPIELAKTLFEAAKEPKTFIVLPEASHNDVYAHGAGDKITEWLQQQLQNVNVESQHDSDE